MQNNTQRETVVYMKQIMGPSATKRYKMDLKHRQRQGWSLVSCTETGKDSFGNIQLTAIYERAVQPTSPMPYPPMQQPGPVMNVQNIPYLLSILDPSERARFEGELQEVVNRWLAYKTQR